MIKRKSKELYFDCCYEMMKIRFVILFFFCCILLISSAYAQEISVPFVGVVNTNKVNIRAGQSTNFESVGVAQKGDQVIVVEKSFNWYKIKLPDGAQCYVSRKLVNFLRDEIGEITGNRVNIRARAAAESSVVGQLNKLTKVKILETTDEWYRIEPAEGMYGWIAVDFIDVQSDAVPPPKVIELPSKNIYVQQRQEQERLRAQEEQQRQEQERRKVSAKGKLVMVPGDGPSADIRHQIVTDDGQVFYLMGYRSILDGFLNQHVYVDGILQEQSSADLPVLLVTKIALIL